MLISLVFILIFASSPASPSLPPSSAHNLLKRKFDNVYS